MAIHKGVMSYTRFSLPSTKEDPKSIVEKINLFRFRPLNPKGEDYETFGFCSAHQPFDDDKPIEVKDCLYDDKIILAVRYDKVTMPKELLRAMVKKSLQTYQRDFNRLPDRVVKKELEIQEAKALRSRILPKTQIVESIWCQKTGLLRVFTRSKPAIDRFIDLFRQAFAENPKLKDFVAEAMSFSEQSGAFLDTLTHQPIFMPPIRTDVQ